MSDARATADVIEALAVAAESSEGPPAAASMTEYLRLSAWYLDSAVDGQSVTSQLRPHESETWRRPDGSWTVTSDGGTEQYPPGARAVLWKDRPPTDPAVLDGWLRAVHPMSGGDPGRLRLQEVTDLLRERVLLPAERAAVLRLVGSIPGIRYGGNAVDRVGRPGEAFVLDIGRPSLPARHTLVVDPESGRVLAYEEMLTQDPGRLNVTIPAVLVYETYLTAEFR